MPTYISQEGLDAMKEELEKRKKVTRREIAENIASAKELGDLSENFEYQEAKERQALNEARVIQLEAQILDAVIVEQTTGSDMIGLGVTFIVEINGDQKTFSMVGSTEADPISGKISNESPIGRAFLGKKAGEEVEIEVPSGVMSYKIVEIQ